jgi:hypothetical protein
VVVTCKHSQRCHDIHHNDIQHINIQHNDTQHNKKLNTTLSIVIECYYVDFQLCLLSMMLSAKNKPFTLSFFMLSVVILSVVMLSVIMLGVVMLSVIMLSVVMPFVIMLNVMLSQLSVLFWVRECTFV